MSMPVLRIEKIKKTGGRTTVATVDAHLTRSRPTPHADPARQHLNQVVYGGGNLSEKVNARLAETGVKVRKDSVIAGELMLSASPDFFRPGSADKGGTWSNENLNAWLKSSVEFLKSEYGENLISATLHLDESTPHIHAVVTPILPGRDGQMRLCAADMWTPQSLSKMQDTYEQAMAPLGIGPRQKHSQARHRTLREYYSTLSQTEEQIGATVKDIKTGIVALPQKKLLESKEAFEARRQDFFKKNLAGPLGKLKKSAVAAPLLKKEEAVTEELKWGMLTRKDEVKKAEQAVEKMKVIIKEKDAELLANKAEIARLRKAPVEEVARLIGHEAPLLKSENAIDLLKRVGGLSYQESVVWLAQNVGRTEAATAAREVAVTEINALLKIHPPVLTRSDKAKITAITEQLDALDAPAYRVTIMSQDETGKKYGVNLGRLNPDKEERFFAKAELLDPAMIRDLSRRNAAGGNVFVTPISEKMSYILVDDVGLDALSKMADQGFAPATVIETSPDNCQLVLKVPSSTPKEARNDTFRQLNQTFGDPKITGLVHPFRLCGFANRKEKHKNAAGLYPFVRLKAAINQVCDRTAALIMDWARQRRHEETLVPPAPAPAPSPVYRPRF